MRSTIPFPGRGDYAADRLPGEDPAVAAMPLLRTLTATLAAAAPFRDACRAAAAPSPWRVPPLAFLRSPESTPPPRHGIPDPVLLNAARRLPDSAAAWAKLRDLLDDVLSLLAESVSVRRTARATPNLMPLAAAFADDHPGVKQLADILAIADDVVILVVHAGARAGWRVRVRGVADLFQFHVLLADAVNGPAARGLLPGPRPDGRIIDAYRDAVPDSEAVATAVFQFYRPDALRPGGVLPGRFEGVEQWLWGHEPLSAVPTVRGEKLLIAGEPPYPRQWPAVRNVRLVAGEVELLEVLTAAAADAWLGRPPAAAARAA